MFPHNITLYHQTTESGSYARSVVNGVLWEDLKGLSIRKHGIASDDRAQIYIPMGSVEPKEGDLVVKGEISTVITKAKDLPQALIITAVETYDYGGSQKHWRVTAK